MDALDNMMIAANPHDRTLAPVSQLEASGNGDIGFSNPPAPRLLLDDKSAESKSTKGGRARYTLKQDHATTQAPLPQMLEIPPPESSMLGGMSQTQ